MVSGSPCLQGEPYLLQISSATESSTLSELSQSLGLWSLLPCRCVWLQGRSSGLEFESEGSLHSRNFLPAAGASWKCWNPRPAQCCTAWILLPGRAPCFAWIPLSSISWGYPRFGHCPGASGESRNLPVLGRQAFLEPALAAGMQVRIR